jgi:hypothetical protein
MGDYVHLGTSAAELLGAARKVKDVGERMKKAMETAVTQIDQLDNPGTFKPDRFTNDFLNGTTEDGGYATLIDSGTDAGMVPRNEAVKLNGKLLGDGAITFGDRGLDAMWAYTDTDDNNASNIKAADA